MIEGQGEAEFRLRVTSGPLTGARFPLQDAVTIGRSSQVEIFVADAGVSRRHAKVFPAPDGTHVLIDLGSANGTFVAGQTVSELPLEPGTVFSVGGTTFVYERATATKPVALDRGVYAVRGDDDGPLERTVVTLHAAKSEPSPTPPPSRNPSWKRIEAKRADGSPYSGDLIGDVILYRNLRLRSERRRALSEQVRGKLEELEQRLRQDQSEHDGCARVFARFACSFPARVRFSRSEGGGHPVEITDFGVGGARLRCRGLLVELDELLWVAVDLVTADGSRTIVFTARVVWQSTEQMGIVFSGAPGWSKHDAGGEVEDTMVLPRTASPKPARPTEVARRANTRTVQLRLASNGDSDDGTEI